MTEVIVSDITIMGDGYCVLALEQTGPDVYRSVRPRPMWGFAWRPPFPHRRGDHVECDLQPLRGACAPHVEDLERGSLQATARKMSEAELIHCLRQAEFSENLHGLFRANLHTSGGGNAWVVPTEAVRSICACRYRNVWFQLFQNAEGLRLRARLGLVSGESLRSLPVVDRDWQAFIEAAFGPRIPADRLKQSENSLNRALYPWLRGSMRALARIGLAREGAGKCWLMLDSLFPQPQDNWLKRIRSTVSMGEPRGRPRKGAADNAL
ncbi:MAG TPA: hypothetical protein VL523_00835 [Terriglobia bacterium]|nr:hypothetical protein [Terriglobia bacterium]